jgi:RimJ/RimL family protein N-acetyltransferase
MDIQLRPVEAADLPTLYDFQCEPDGVRMAVVEPRDPDDYAAHWAKVLVDPKVAALAIVADGVLVGQISLFQSDGLDSVGYWLGQAFWGRGIASRALELFLQRIPTRPLHARAAKDNVGSLRVLQKGGFRVTEYRMSAAKPRYPACEEAILILE